MSAWREKGCRSKAGTIAWLALLMVIGASDSAWLSGGSFGRKRVFSPGFVVLCIFVAVVELIALLLFYNT